MNILQCRSVEECADVFGDWERSTEERPLRQLDSMVRHDPQADCWTEWSPRLRVGIAGASAAAIGSSIYVFGSYNKPRFDQFFQLDEAAARALQSMIFHALIDRKVKKVAWNYHGWAPDTNEPNWRDLGRVPYAPDWGSGMNVDDVDVLPADGEIKLGLREASVKSTSIQNDEMLGQTEKGLSTTGQTPTRRCHGLVRNAESLRVASMRA